MFKKAVSLFSVFAFLILTVSSAVLAADLNTDLIATPIALSVSNSGNPQAFDPGSGQTLTATVNFKTTKVDGTGTVLVKQGATTIKSLQTINGFDANVPLVLIWNGKDIENNAAAQGVCGTQGGACPNGDYSIVASVSAPSGSDNLIDTETATFKIGSAPTTTINTFDLTPTPVKSGGTFDPSINGDNQDLLVNFSLNQTVESINLEIKDPSNKVVKIDAAANLANGSFSWNGEFGGKIWVPGTYQAKLTATKSGQSPVTSTKSFTINYGSANKGTIENLAVTPTAFDPDFEDAVIEFKNTKDTNITVEIKDSNNDVIKTFDVYTDDNYPANKTHSVSWNGTSTSGSTVPLTTYKAIVTTRNDFGVVVGEKNVTVNDSGGSVSASNAHIAGIHFSPSSKFEPAEDDELEIEFDVEQDIDELKIFAVRGADKIELYSEDDIEKEDNLQVTWDGTDDDDEYVADGSWKIQFESKLGSSKLLAVKSINVDYEKPEIKDLYLSKSKFDNDEGEFTNILFRVDADAEVTIKVLNDGDEDDDVVEDMEVQADVWYSVQWDGGGFDYDDNLDLKLIAENIANEDVFDSEKVDVDLLEDKVSGSKTNVTQDYIDPPITDGLSDMTIYYTLDDDADVTITIHSGKSTTGTTRIELLDVDDQGSGEHSVTWDGRDENGKKFAAGFYTYKILAKSTSSEVESGVFVVGDVGEDLGGGSDDDDDKTGGGGVGPGVIVDGGSPDDVDDGDDDDDAPTFDDCAGFKDVGFEHKNCTAIEWAQDSGVFVGYNDGTFQPEKPINRVEFLKVVLLALGIKEDYSTKGDLGFKDVIVGEWYMPFVAKAKALGIFVGDQGKGTARPADPVNRAEALKIAFTSLQAAGGNVSLDQCYNIYKDVPVDGWFYPYVGCFNNVYSLIDPVNAANFVPNKPVTRAEVAEMLYRLYSGNIL